MAVTGIYLLHKSWCKRQKNDHMIATLLSLLENIFNNIYFLVDIKGSKKQLQLGQKNVLKKPINLTSPQQQCNTC
jgi:hypothetical protein